MRAIVLGDAHGRTELITNVLRHSNYNPDEDRLIFAGDALDIGPDGRECLDILAENKAIFLLGNHELSIILHHPVGPQNTDSWMLFGRLLRMRAQGKLKIAAVHDNVLITHAGLSSVYYMKYKDWPLIDIAGDLNAQSNNSSEDAQILEQYWNDDSPIWYRPGSTEPYPDITQICGHTPVSYVRKYFSKFNLENFYMIDPYTPNNFESKDRYRYATIEKGGKVIIHDSRKTEGFEA